MLMLLFAMFQLPIPSGVPLPFTEEAAARGIQYLLNQNWEVVPFGDGVAFADLDRDGDPDIVAVGRADDVPAIYENNGLGFFSERTPGLGLLPIEKVTGVVAADYDRDGDLDIYFSCWGTSNVLWRNNGGFQFTNVTTASGTGDMGQTAGCAWGDYDGDGWLDLYTSNRDGANKLYRNKGDGTFEDMAALLGVEQTDQLTFQASFFDFDQDGDADLYISNDRGVGNCPTFHNALFENQNGNFVDITDAQTEACTDSMSVAIGDFSGNGFLDLYVTSTGLGNALLTNQGDGSFLRAENEAGVASMAVAWGSYFFDYNNNGHNELYVANMMHENRLFAHGGTWPCTDLASALNLNDSGQSFGVAGADVDGDGDVDLLLTNRGESLKLLINHEGEQRNYVRFRVIGQGPDYWAVGARVSLTAGTVSGIAEVVAGSNYKAQNELVLHMGLDGETLIQNVVVSWPGGLNRTLSNLSANQTWTLYPQEKLGDGDQNGIMDPSDVDHFCHCFTQISPVGLLPGCEMMDSDGDGDVDLHDLETFLISYTGLAGWGENQPVWDHNNNGVTDLTDLVHHLNRAFCLQ